MRRVIFERLGVKPIEKPSDARKQRVFECGKIFHLWMQRITKEAGLSIAQELELQDEELKIRGHIDDLVLVKYPFEIDAGELGTLTTNVPEPHLILYDYKTRNSRNWSYAKQPSYHHKMQLGTYMYMLRKETELLSDGGLVIADTSDLTEARILNIEKDTLRMAEVQYMWSDELEHEILTYWKTLNRYWAEKKIPPCTCADHDGGYMATEAWNNFWYNGEPCSLELYKLRKEEGSLRNGRN